MKIKFSQSHYSVYEREEILQLMANQIRIDASQDLGEYVGTSLSTFKNIKHSDLD